MTNERTCHCRSLFAPTAQRAAFSVRAPGSGARLFGGCRNATNDDARAELSGEDDDDGVVVVASAAATHAPSRAAGGGAAVKPPPTTRRGGYRAADAKVDAVTT